MQVTKSAQIVCCGVMGMVTLVVGALCFCVPAITNGSPNKAEVLSGIFLCLMSICWFILAHLYYKQTMMKQRQGEQEVLLRA